MQFLSDIQAIKIFEFLPNSTQSRLISRGGNYGIPASDLLRKMPKNLLDNPEDIEQFLNIKEISHEDPISKGGSPNNFDNWNFEDSQTNRVRGANQVTFEEKIYTDLDNQIDAYLIDSKTPDNYFNETQLKDIETILNPENQSLSSQFFELNLDDAISGGLSTGYVIGRPVNSAFKFLRKIDWKQFVINYKYRNTIFDKAIKTFLEEGWEELAKSIVIGFMIVSFPPLRYLLIGKYTAGLMSLGFRWLSARKFLSGKVGLAFARIGDSLDNIASFFKKLFKLAENLIDGLVEIVISVAKKIGQIIQTIAQDIFDWIMNFFDPQNERKVINISTF